MKPSYEELEEQLSRSRRLCDAALANERAWETAMMKACGEDGPKSVADKFAALEQNLAASQREFRAADATIENLQMQLNAEREAKLALAAENAGLKQFPDQIVGFIGKLGSSEIGSETKEKIEAAAKKIKTPATDDFLAEVRAQGVEMFASVLQSRGRHQDYVEIANAYAAQLRKGVQP